MYIVLYWASGHGRVVANAIECIRQYTIMGFVDDTLTAPSFGYPLLGGQGVLESLVRAQASGAVVTIGNNVVRRERASAVELAGLALVSVVHPAAVVAEDVAVGAGTVIHAGSVVNPGVSVGRNVIVNTGATIDHDSSLSDGCHISPEAHLAGSVSVGEDAHVGLGALLVPGCRIGHGAMVGAGAVVITDIPPDETWVGNPARRTRKRASR